MKDLYYVALKLFLRRGGKLLIIKDVYEGWDMPGGRIRKDEFSALFEKIIARKVREELGPYVRYTLGKPLVFMRHERHEAALPSRPKVRIFAVGYEGRWRGGEIKLGPVHKEFRWVPIRTFRPDKYFKGGWLKGVKEYLRSKRRTKR